MRGQNFMTTTAAASLNNIITTTASHLTKRPWLLTRKGYERYEGEEAILVPSCNTIGRGNATKERMETNPHFFPFKTLRKFPQRLPFFAAAGTGSGETTVSAVPTRRS